MQPPELPPPPPAPDAWSPQPWPGGGSPPVAYQAPPRRPGSVTAASVLLIVLAVPPVLFSILAFIGAGLFHRVDGRFTEPALRDLSETVVHVIVVLGVISLAYGVTKLIAGIRVLAASNAWRITGIVLAVLASGFWLLALIGTIGGNDTTTATGRNNGSTASGVVVSAVFLAMNVLAIVLLARSGEYFEAGRFPAGLTGPAPPPPQPWQQQQQWPQQQQRWPPGGSPG